MCTHKKSKTGLRSHAGYQGPISYSYYSVLNIHENHIILRGKNQLNYKIYFYIILLNNSSRNL